MFQRLKKSETETILETTTLVNSEEILTQNEIFTEITSTSTEDESQEISDVIIPFTYINDTTSEIVNDIETSEDNTCS